MKNFKDPLLQAKEEIRVFERPSATTVTALMNDIERLRAIVQIAFQCDVSGGGVATFRKTAKRYFDEREIPTEPK